jgi:hypothetical protein
MRRLFFERELPELNLRVMADPAEQQVLVLALDAGQDADAGPGGRWIRIGWRRPCRPLASAPW